MALIYGAPTGHAVVSDTDGDDTIIAAGGGHIIFDNAGNDTISAGSLGGNTIYAGMPFDGDTRDVTIHVNGLGSVTFAGVSKSQLSAGNFAV